MSHASSLTIDPGDLRSILSATALVTGRNGLELLSVLITQNIIGEAFIHDTYWGVIAIHLAVQTGLCASVLTNYTETVVIYFVLQKQFVGALTLGANKK